MAEVVLNDTARAALVKDVIFDLIDAAREQNNEVEYTHSVPDLVEQTWKRLSAALASAAPGREPVSYRFVLPVEVYLNGVEIGDKTGHICTAENPEIAKAIVAALNAAPAPSETRGLREAELSSDDLRLIDQAWENHKAALPVATVINNNQPGRTAIIEITIDPPTLDVGAKLYAEPKAITIATPSAPGLVVAAEERDRLIEALTPSAETKAAYIGEFTLQTVFINEDGDECVARETVPWTTIKEIMAAIRARATGRVR